MKKIKKILLILLVLFIAAQIFGPKRNLGDIASVEPFLKETNPPEDVKIILKESCYDCHSSNTRYPWYNNITPVNYWLESYISDGKKHFNMSEWDGSSLKRKDHKFEDLIEAIEKKWMPLDEYTWMHADAKLTDVQTKAVVDWAKQVRFKYSLEAKPE